MSAVATPTRHKAASRKIATPKAATAADVSEHGPARIKAAFGQIEVLIQAAHDIDEDHPWSGDSDRLLRMAFVMAGQAHASPPTGFATERIAFDIAALIRAARLVPGDSESQPRKALIDQAAVHLNWLTETASIGVDSCDPEVPRPAAPGAMLPSLPGSASDEAECIELARQATYEIQKLAETMQMVAGQLGNEEDQPIAHGLMARILVLSDITYHAAALHGEGRAESAPLKELQRAFKGSL